MVGLGLGDFHYSAPHDARIAQIGRGKGANLKVVPAEHEPLHHVNHDKVQDSDPGLNLARLYAQSRLPKGCRLVLIPSARGGAPISEWLPGNRMHKDLTRRINAALKAFPKGEVVHLAWQPGETEMGMPVTTPDRYRQDMETIIRDLRATYGPFTVTVGEPPRAWVKPTRQQYLAATRRALTHVGRAAIVPSEGLASNPGQPIHFNAAAQMELGKRHYETLVTLGN